MLAQTLSAQCAPTFLPSRHRGWTAPPRCTLRRPPSEGRRWRRVLVAPCRCTLDASRSWPVRRALTVRWISRVCFRTPTRLKAISRYAVAATRALPQTSTPRNFVGLPALSPYQPKLFRTSIGGRGTASRSFGWRFPFLRFCTVMSSSFGYLGGYLGGKRHGAGSYKCSKSP